MPQVLIETRLNSLKLCESAQVRKGCLGRLEGICADFVNPTRNGRYYSRELWENVFNDDLVKEALQTKTLIGELDHPEERFETLAQEACVVMTDYKFNEDTLTGGFDILDTQRGRTLKALLDYGCVMGVSSRGQGDLSTNSEYEVVDPDTYDFAGFDVVLTPAVKRARQKVTESSDKKSKVNEDKKLKPLTESLNNEINATTSVDALDSIKSLIESANLPNSAELISAISDKRKSIEEGKTISDKIKKDLRTAKLKNSKLEKQLESVKNETIKEKNELNKTISTMTSKILAYKHREKRLSEVVSAARRENVKLIRRVETAKDAAKDANTALKLESNKVRSNEIKIQKLQDKLSNMNESLSSKERLVRSMRSELNASKKKAEKLEGLNEELNKSIKNSKTLTESINKDNTKTLNENRKLKANLRTALSSYATSCAAKYGLTESMVKSITANCTSVDEINSILKNASDKNDRYAALPFTDFNDASASLIENVNIKSDEVNEEMKTTERFLETALGLH